MNKKHTMYLTQLGLFIAIELIFCFTPLGSIPIPFFPGIVATLAHIPAIVGALMLGYTAATILGAVMGFSSLYVWTFMPPIPPAAFVFTPFTPNGNFWSLIICILPRVLFPIVAVWIFNRLKNKGLSLSAIISAVISTFTHSILVLSIIYFAFNSNSSVGGNYLNVLIAWGGFNAVLEMITAGIISGALIKVLHKLNK